MTLPTLESPEPSVRMSEGDKEAVRADKEVVAKAEVAALQKQIRELQRVLAIGASRLC